MDGGTPQRASVVNVPVTINVVRNSNGPVFAVTAFTREVNQNANVGDNIIQVTAFDADGTVRIMTFITLYLLYTEIQF